jgi:cell wall-associated NlpC family hydrolase
VNEEKTLERARAALALKEPVRYLLGAGGKDPRRTTPAVAGACDCSGFVAWCLGTPRKLPKPVPQSMLDYNGGWLSTSGIHHDATGAEAKFREENAGWGARLGGLLVYPDWKDAGNRKRQGHVAVISEVVDGVVTKIIHCSMSNQKGGKSAIQETGPKAFDRADAIYVEWLG